MVREALEEVGAYGGWGRRAKGSCPGGGCVRVCVCVCVCVCRGGVGAGLGCGTEAACLADAEGVVNQSA